MVKRKGGIRGERKRRKRYNTEIGKGNRTSAWWFGQQMEVP
jgi:hypothetical protein